MEVDAGPERPDAEEEEEEEEAEAEAEAERAGSGEREGASGGPPAWLDTSRYYPQLLPFRPPPPRGSVGPASPLPELGLRRDGSLVSSQTTRYMVLQLPALPLCTASGAPAVGLDGLGDGALGCLTVHASGAVKLCVGDVLFDIHPGAPLTHCEQIVALNTGGRKAVVLGTAAARCVVTPDVVALLAAAEAVT